MDIFIYEIEEPNDKNEEKGCFGLTLQTSKRNKRERERERENGEVAAVERRCPVLSRVCGQLENAKHEAVWRGMGGREGCQKRG